MRWKPISESSRSSETRHARSAVQNQRSKDLPTATRCSELTYGGACTIFYDTMQQLQPSSFKRLLRRTLVVCVAICMVLTSSAFTISWGTRGCSSASETGVKADTQERVTHTCCCCREAPRCDCDLQEEDSPPLIDLAPSSTQSEQRPILSGYDVADSRAILGCLGGKMPSESFIFARAPATIYLLNLTFLC
jgi:hypothetical protein